MDIVDEVGFDESFSFIYSPRPNTPASEMEDNVSIEIKKERLSILQHKLNELSSKISRKMVGTIENCLVIGADTMSKLLDWKVCLKKILENFRQELKIIELLIFLHIKM